MSEHTKKTQITVDDVTYNYEDLTFEQQKLFRHCVSLDSKINSASDNLEQLMGGKEHFIKKLKDSLESK
jgi:hypothetical protein